MNLDIEEYEKELNDEIDKFFNSLRKCDDIGIPICSERIGGMCCQLRCAKQQSPRGE